MHSNTWRNALVLLVSFCFLITACTNTRVTSFPNEQTPGAHPDIKVGNWAKVTLNTGEVVQFKVTAIEADGLVGENGRVAYTDMRFLEVREVSGWRSLGLAFGVVVAVGVAALIHLITHIAEDD